MMSKQRSSVTVSVLAIVLCALSLESNVVKAQVYGVARRTTVVHGSGGTVVAGSTTVVRGGAALPAGYFCCLPTGYRSVYVRGVRYYAVGGIYYQPRFYSGRTVYVRVHI